MEQKQIDLVMHSLTKQQYDNAVAQGQIEMEQLYLASQPAFAVSSDVTSQFQRMMDKIGEFVPPVPPPPAFTEIEYLESTGTQMIDTGYVPTLQTSVNAKYTPLEKTGNVTFGCSWRDDDNKDWRYFDYSGGTIFDCGTARVGQSYVVTLNTTYVIDFGGNSSNQSYLKIYDSTGTSQLYSSSKTAGGTLDVDGIKLFGGYTLTSYIKSRIYYFKIFEAGELVRDFIPVRVGDVGYMYDNVTNQLFSNIGTGNFTLGPDK